MTKIKMGIFLVGLIIATRPCAAQTSGAQKEGAGSTGMKIEDVQKLLEDFERASYGGHYKKLDPDKDMPPAMKDAANEAIRYLGYARDARDRMNDADKAQRREVRTAALEELNRWIELAQVQIQNFSLYNQASYLQRLRDGTNIQEILLRSSDQDEQLKKALSENGISATESARVMDAFSAFRTRMLSRKDHLKARQEFVQYVLDSFENCSAEKGCYDALLKIEGAINRRLEDRKDYSLDGLGATLDTLQFIASWNRIKIKDTMNYMLILGMPYVWKVQMRGGGVETCNPGDYCAARISAQLMQLVQTDPDGRVAPRTADGIRQRLNAVQSAEADTKIKAMFAKAMDGEIFVDPKQQAATTLVTAPSR